MMWLWLLSLACRDPRLAPLKDALNAYDAGRAALASGNAPEAARQFATAAKTDPQSPSLPAWQAWAQDKAGDVAGARATLDAALTRFPDDATLRYNRASLLARAGELDASAEDLRVLYANGVVDPLDVGEDPDFQALSQDPLLASLAPPPKVLVAVRGEAGAVLLGEAYTAEITLQSHAGALVSFSDMGEPTGLLRHLRTVEDVAPPEGRMQTRTISVTWRAIAAGQGKLGPWLVDAGGVSAVTEAADVAVVAVPGRAGGVPDEADTTWSVSAVFEGRSAPWAGRAHGGVLVIPPPGARVSVTGSEIDPEPVALELRASGQTQATGQLYRMRGAAHVQIVSGGATLLDQDIPAEAIPQ